MKTPLLVNPWEVVHRLKEKTISDSNLSLMAGMLPIMFLGALFLMVVLVVLVFSAMSYEKKLLKIIDALSEGVGRESGPSSG